MKARILYPLTILLVVILSFPTLAQPGDKREDIESMKIAFLSRRLNLTPEEAKKFWPVYNQFSEELKSVRETRNKAGRDVKDNFQQMTDKEIEKVVDSEISYRQQELDILKKYNAQFKQTLPMRKVALLYRAEDDFKKELLERIKERREQKMGGPRPR